MNHETRISRLEGHQRVVDDNPARYMSDSDILISTREIIGRVTGRDGIAHALRYTRT